VFASLDRHAGARDPQPGPGPPHRPGRPGVHRAPARVAGQAGRPAPRPPGPRPGRPGADRLGQRLRAQPGDAAVLPARAPPPRPVAPHGPGPRGLRVLGPRGVAAAGRPLAAAAVVDGDGPDVERAAGAVGAPARLHRGRLRRGRGAGPAHRRPAVRPGAQEGGDVGALRRQDGAGVPLRRGPHHRPPRPGHLRPHLRHARAVDPGRRPGPAGAVRGRRPARADRPGGPGPTASPPSAASPTTTGSTCPRPGPTSPSWSRRGG
jgi:hypothetical protein